MSEEAKIIRIIVDSSKAIDGSAAATRALQNLERQTGSMDSTLAKMEKSLASVGPLMAAESARTAQQRIDTTKKIVADLEFERAQLARNSLERSQYDAVRRAGVTAASAEGQAIMKTVAALENERAALRQVEAARLAASKTGAASGPMTAQQRLMLSYQTNDIFTSLVGGMNPAMIAAQQGPQITQIFGGLRNTIAAIPKPALMAGGALLGGLAIGAALKEISDVNEALELQQRRFTSLFGTRDQATATYRDIAKMAADTATSISAASEQVVAFAHATQALGATRQNVVDVATLAEKLTQISGATKQEGTAAQGALADMLKSGTVNAEQLNTVLANVPQIVDKIAAGLGVSVTQLRLMAVEGDLNSKQVFGALLLQTKTVNAQFADMPKTIGSVLRSVAVESEELAASLARSVSGLVLIKSKTDALRASQAANSNRPTPAAPRVIGANGSTMSLAEQVLSGEAGLTDAATLNNARQLQSQMTDLQRAQQKAMAETIVSAVDLATKLNPLTAGMAELRQQTAKVSEALEVLQSQGFTGLDASKAAQETKNLAETMQWLRAKSLEARTAYSQALEAVETHQQQNELGLTPGQRAEQSRIKQYMGSQPGVSVEDARTVVNGEQLRMLDEVIVKQARELDLQSAVTTAMRSGKVAADEAAVAMQVLGISFEQLGTITPELQVRLDVLAETLRLISAQRREQANIDAAKPLLDDLAGIAAAMKVVEKGAFAMKRAEADARAARAENGTGPLQMEVFDSRQALTDAAMLSNLQDQIDLTNKLAAAAGNVAQQKRIQLEFDIKRAQEEAAPAAAAEIAEKKRAQAAADLRLNFAEGTAELQRQNVVLEAQLRLINEAPVEQAKQLALIKATQDAQKAGKTLSAEEREGRRLLIDQNETLKHQAEEQKQTAERWASPWKDAFQTIHRAGVDMWDKFLLNFDFSARSMVDTFKTAARRVAAELLALATIRPVIGLGVQALGKIGILSPSTVASMGFGSIASGAASGVASGVAGGIAGGGAGAAAGTGFSLGNWGTIGSGIGLGSALSGGSSGGGWFSGIGSWLNSPIGGNAGGFSAYELEALGGAGSGLGGMAASPGMFGSITPMGALGGLGSLFSIGMGINTLASGKGGVGGTIGGLSGIIGGGIGLGSLLIPAMAGMGPIGLGIGLIGALLGGLLGGGDEPPIPPQPELVLNIGGFMGTSSGRFYSAGSGSGGGGSLRSTAQGVGSAVSRLFRASDVSPIPGQMFGGSIISGVDHVLNGRNWQDRPYTQAGINPPGGGVEWVTYNDPSRNVQQAADLLIAAVFRANVMRGGVSGATEALKAGLTAYDPQTAKDTQTVVALAGAYDKLGKVTGTAKEALEKITASFDDLADFADRAGLAMKPINDEIEKQSKRWAQDFLDNMLDPLAAGLRALGDERDSALASAEYIRAHVEGVYVDMDRISTYYTNKEAQLRDQFYQGAVKNLQNLIARLSYGDLANASPDTSLTGVRGTYLSTLAQARAGVATAITSLPGVAETYATSARGYFASSPEYAALVADIRRNLEEVVAVTTGGGTPASGAAQQLNEASQTLVAANEQLREIVSDQSRQVEDLKNMVSTLVLKLGAIASNRM